MIRVKIYFVNLKMYGMNLKLCGSPEEQYSYAVRAVGARLDEIIAAGALFGQSFDAPREVLLREALEAHFLHRVRLDVHSLLEFVNVQDVRMSEFRACALKECTRVVNEKLALCLEGMPLLDVVVDASHPLVLELYALLKEEVCF